MQPGLAFEQAPPLGIPFRFFLTAPAFGVLAGLLLVWRGPEALSSRWSPAALALTHLLALGFITMTMAGALMQMLPVLAGSPVSRLRILARAVHLPLTSGALLLPAGFLTGHRGTLLAAVALLAAALALLVAILALNLARAAVRSATVTGMRHAALGLAAAASLGATLALRRAGVDLAPGTDLTPLHVAWGLLGWVLPLVIAVAWQVVPMFQLTPPYPAHLSRRLTGALLTGLVLWSWAALAAAAPEPLLAAALALACGLFAVVTLRLQSQRRRRRRDFTLLFWRLAMVSLVLASLLWATLPLLPAAAADVAAPVLGALALAGVALSAITGMLYKIVPFLSWFHLQALAGGRWRVPSMNEALTESAMRLQFAWHCGTLGMVAAAFMVPEPLARMAGAALAVSSTLLARNLAGSARLYRDTRVKIEGLRRLESPVGPHG